MMSNPYGVEAAANALRNQFETIIDERRIALARIDALKAEMARRAA